MKKLLFCLIVCILPMSVLADSVVNDTGSGAGSVGQCGAGSILCWRSVDETANSIRGLRITVVDSTGRSISNSVDFANDFRKVTAMNQKTGHVRNGYNHCADLYRNKIHYLSDYTDSSPNISKYCSGWAHTSQSNHQIYYLNFPSYAFDSVTTNAFKTYFDNYSDWANLFSGGKFKDIRGDQGNLTYDKIKSDPRDLYILFEPIILVTVNSSGVNYWVTLEEMAGTLLYDYFKNSTGTNCRTYYNANNRNCGVEKLVRMMANSTYLTGALTELMGSSNNYFPGKDGSWGVNIQKPNNGNDAFTQNNLFRTATSQLVYGYSMGLIKITQNNIRTCDWNNDDHFPSTGSVNCCQYFVDTGGYSTQEVCNRAKQVDAVKGNTIASDACCSGIQEACDWKKDEDFPKCCDYFRNQGVSEAAVCARNAACCTGTQKEETTGNCNAQSSIYTLKDSFNTGDNGCILTCSRTIESSAFGDGINNVEFRGGGHLTVNDLSVTTTLTCNYNYVGKGTNWNEEEARECRAKSVKEEDIKNKVNHGAFYIGDYRYLSSIRADIALTKTEQADLDTNNTYRYTTYYSLPEQYSYVQKGSGVSNNNSSNSIYIGPHLPIHYTTETGTYDISLKWSIGEASGKYTCKYVVDNDLFDNENNTETEKKDPNEDANGVDLIFRPISLVNPFPGQNNDSTRTIGSNWTRNNYVQTVISDKQNIYEQEPIYRIRLDANAINRIRTYNDNHSYNDFLMNCSNDSAEAGKRCNNNEFLNEIRTYDGNVLVGKCVGVNQNNFYDCAN